MARVLAVAAAVIFGVVFATANFFYFQVNRELAFQFHNGAALLLGIAILVAGYVLLKRGSGSGMLYVPVMVAGLWMATAHVVKLAIGHCI